MVSAKKASATPGRAPAVNATTDAPGAGLLGAARRFPHRAWSSGQTPRQGVKSPSIAEPASGLSVEMKLVSAWLSTMAGDREKILYIEDDVEAAAILAEE